MGNLIIILKVWRLWIVAFLPSVCIYLSIYLSIYISVCLSICLHISFPVLFNPIILCVPFSNVSLCFCIICLYIPTFLSPLSTPLLSLSFLPGCLLSRLSTPTKYSTAGRQTPLWAATLPPPSSPQTAVVSGWRRATAQLWFRGACLSAFSLCHWNREAALKDSAKTAREKQTTTNKTPHNNNTTK